MYSCSACLPLPHANLFQINELQRVHKCLEWEAPFQYKTIVVPHDAMDRFARQDWSQHEKLRGHKLDRLAQMKEYAYSAECRVKQIRNMFGMVDETDCGKCDNCLAKKSVAKEAARGH